MVIMRLPLGSDQPMPSKLSKRLDNLDPQVVRDRSEVFRKSGCRKLQRVVRMSVVSPR